MTLLSMRQYAAHRAKMGKPVTPMAVSKAVKSGRIKLVDGKIDPDQADRDWQANTNAKQQRVQPSAKAPRPVREPVDGESLNEAQTRKEIALANLRELEEGEKRKSLLPADEVRDAVNGMVMAFRAKCLVIGDELADKLAATSDPVRCRVMVDERVSLALASLAEYPADAA